MSKIVELNIEVIYFLGGCSQQCPFLVVMSLFSLSNCTMEFFLMDFFFWVCSNQKSNVKMIRHRSVEQMLATSLVPELGHRTEPRCVFRSRNVRCQSTNGAANGAPGHANSTTTSSLIGFEAENLIPNSLPKFDDNSSLEQIGVGAVEQLSKVHLEEEDSDTILQGFSTVEEAIQAIKQGKV